MSDLGKTVLGARRRLGTSSVEMERQREQSSSWQGFLGGYLLGTVVGMVIALLIAPRRGEETRRVLSASAGELRDRATGLVHQARSDAEPSSAAPRRDVTTGPAIERTFGD